MIHAGARLFERLPARDHLRNRRQDFEAFVTAPDRHVVAGSDPEALTARVVDRLRADVPVLRRDRAYGPQGATDVHFVAGSADVLADLRSGFATEPGTALAVRVPFDGAGPFALRPTKTSPRPVRRRRGPRAGGALGGLTARLQGDEAPSICSGRSTRSRRGSAGSGRTPPPSTRTSCGALPS